MKDSFNISNFPARRLSQREDMGLTEYVSKHLDIAHLPIIMEAITRYHMSGEQAVGYAIAMFTAIEDLIFFHMEFEVGGFSVKVGAHYGVDKDRVSKYRKGFTEPYFNTLQTRIAKIRDHLSAMYREDPDYRIKIFSTEDKEQRNHLNGLIWKGRKRVYLPRKWVKKRKRKKLADKKAYFKMCLQ